ncbi:hypothetical protein COU59_00305 [Candidatus Pacearchaeota archaeon CG10_big_fil_rev_8_21_14_0_10_34_12]|nr:MAG: hypothetical protein COU59_00305 [Candidatus Pacearchaeota archaeon CG10_big_fil_rev_8_21_14_0_10_34_12]
MDKRNIIFWVFAVIQGFLIYSFSLTITLGNIPPENLVGLEVLGNVFKIYSGLLAISTIVIEYLIYSKK